MKSRTRSVLRWSGLGLAVAGGLIAACGSDDAKRPALSLNEAPAETLTDEADRLSRLQMIRVYDHQPPAGTPAGWREATVDEVANGGVGEHCRLAQPDVNTPVGYECALSERAVRMMICRAHLLADLAGLRATPLRLVNLSGPRFDVPQQSSAGQAALLRSSLFFLNGVFTFGLPAITPVTGSCFTNQGVGPDPSVNLATHMPNLIGSLIETYYLRRELTEKASDAFVAFADYQRAHPSLKIGQDRGLYGTQLSRAEAARLWVGGNIGLDAGFRLCTSPELNGASKTALSALRESGVPPSWITDTNMSTNTILENGTSSSASVKARLAKFWDQAAMTNAASGTLTKQLGVTIADFDAARAYLSQEIKVFARSFNAQKDIDPVAGATNTTRWGATATEPVRLPDAYYAARGGVQDGSEASKIAAMPLPGDSFAEFVDGMGTFVSTLLRDGVFPAGVKDRNVDPLLLLLTDISRERLGRFTYSPPVPPATGFLFWVDGFAPTDGMYALIGEDAVRCATVGKVEGATCTLKTTGLTTPAPTDLLAAPLTVARTPAVGFSTAAQIVAGGIAPAGLGTRVYLAKSATGVPGSFQVLAGMSVWPSAGTSPITTSVVPAADSNAAKILAPSSKWCTLPKTDCDGTPFDDRLPLENELSDDNDGVESSWKHYLTLARQAANEADALAENYVNAGIQNEQRGEDNELREKANDIQMMESLNQLQDTCGTSVDPVALLDLFKDLNVMHGAGSGTACSSDSACAVTPTNGFAAGLKCYGARCVKDPVATAATILPPEQASRLTNCLSNEAVTDFATLGDVPVCIWHAAGNVNEVCRGYNDTSFRRQDHPCPELAVNGACTSPSFSAPPGHTVKTVTTTLGYFHPSQSYPAQPKTDAICDDLRQLRQQAAIGAIRTATGAQQFLNVARFFKIAQSDFFHPKTLGGVARRIGWQYGFGAYSAILVDGEPRWTTGDMWRGAETARWPCNTTVPTSCTGGRGLFCQTVSNCATNVDARVKANELMYRAVEAVRVIAGPQSTTGVNGPPGWTSLDSCNPTFSGGLRGRWQLPSNPAAVVNVYDIRKGALTATGYRIDSATQSDKRAWRSTKYFFAGPHPAGAFNPVGLTEVVPTEYVDWFTDQEDCYKIFYETHPGTPAFSADTTSYGDREFWDNLSSAPPSGMKVKQAGYFSGVLSGSRDYTDVGVYKAQHIFNRYDVLKRDRPDIREQLRPFDFEPDDLFNGMELLCEVGVGATPSCDPSKPPQIRSLEDLSLAKDYLDCVAGAISQHAGRGVLAKIPTDALDALRKQSVMGAFPANGGDWGVALSNLNAALVALSHVEPQLAGEIRLLGYDINAVRTSLARAGIAKQIADVQLASTVADRLAQCADSMLVGAVTFGLGSIVPCVNSIAQINLANQLNELTNKDNDLAKELEINNFGSTFATRAQNLDRYGRQFAEQVAIVDASLATLEKLRAQARNALAKALFMRTNVASNTMNINVAYRNRFNTARLRYEEAHKNAKRMAFIAKRAIEQRLGVRLAEMREDLPLVEAPANWESQVCNARGIDFERDIVERNPDGGAPAVPANTNLVDMYIGEYVTRLENLVESYRLVHGFHEGTDTAVVSLRDDIQRVRAECEVPINNVLRYSSTLDQPSTEESPGWDRLGCATTTTGGVTTEVPTCVDARPAQALAFRPREADTGLPNVYEVVFGTGTATCDPATCGYTTNTALAQNVDLVAGKYILSWYADSAVATANPGFVSVRGRDRALILNSQTAVGTPATGELQRYFMLFTVSNDQPGTIEIRAPSATVRKVKIGGFQLDRIEDPAQTTPKRYVESRGSSTRPLKLCEDTDGSEFRGTRWTRGCVNLCADGFSSSCDASHVRPYCYRETTFSINQRDIEDRKMFVSSGFARGNFNYRIESVGVNFVGSNTRNCEDSTTPQTCLSAGFIPYSLYHTGPFYVRNHFGHDVQAMLFDGRIEHARGLASERYLTNPLGSADNELISQYLRGEYQGRPLDGSFALRVWDEDGVNFDGIRDVQVVLKYRYWTRLN